MSFSVRNNKPGMSRFVALMPADIVASIRRLLLVAGCVLVSGCGESDDRVSNVSQGTEPVVPPVSVAESYPGGSSTTSLAPFPRFDKPVPTLPDSIRPDFHAGRALAHQPWVKAPTITDARDGLGPIYNARACLACHVRGGKGMIPSDSHAPLFSGLVKMSVPVEQDGHTRWLPEPSYGEQLQTQSVALSHQLRQSNPQQMAAAGQVAPEAYAYIQWSEQAFTYPNGESVALRRPTLDLQHLAYGDMHPSTRFSLRNAPMIHGMGLLERVPPSQINALADPEDHNQDGVSGRVNQVIDARTGELAPGRFGLKANRASIDEVVAGAFANDLGISNPMFPRQPCTDVQPVCLKQPNGNGTASSRQQGLPDATVELSQELLDLVVQFTHNLGVPERRNGQDAAVQAGRTSFYQSGCAMCHNPSFQTAASSDSVADETGLSHLANQTIWPYTDLLVHDMGEALADHRPDGTATGSEWRTAPLWGIGLLGQVNGSQQLLHDGRARSVEEAILWHGGEATLARERFIQLSPSERQQLLAFVESL